MEHCFLYTPYADDATFFLKDSQSMEHLVEPFNSFFVFFRIKEKYETAGVGALKGVQLAVCGMKYIDLLNESNKMLGTSHVTTR